MPSRHWSPEPELHNGAHAKAFRYDPYRPAGMVFYFEDEDVHPSHDEPAAPPAGTRHVSLWGRVSFVPYPTQEFSLPPPPVGVELVRVFIGQLPYFVTDQQLAWLCVTFGGHAVASPERIMKKQPSGDRLPTGCIHAYTTPEAVHAMAYGMHKRMLVDDTGVWHAQTYEEVMYLKQYIAAMKADKSLRVPNRPYDSVVVQIATSTFVPVHPMPIEQMPAERKGRHAPKRGTPSGRSSPAPEERR